MKKQIVKTKIKFSFFFIINVDVRGILRASRLIL